MLHFAVVVIGEGLVVGVYAVASLPMRWPFLLTTTAPGRPRYIAQSVPAISWAISLLAISSLGSCPVVRMAGAPQQESMYERSAPTAWPILWPSPVFVVQALVASILKEMCIRDRSK